MEKEKQLKELKQLVQDYETLLSIHIGNKIIKDSKEAETYFDLILDKISEANRMIQRLEKE
ncbi:hypothetical protein LJC12_00685 [Odoribacter sp. OttesenSCG-928-J03]|nr:hypothetical protein [Odoribacter sp. OttesenSCG-928-J03]MDL2283245.1 hypothetical protein [Odoribacter sp. OttesenSCG-928-G04]